MAEKPEIKTEIKYEVKTEEEEWPTEQLLALPESSPKPEVSVKFCKICQQTSNHSTSKCPTLVCSNCGQNGHVEKICLKVKRKRSLTLLKKHRGRIKSFSEGRGWLTEQNAEKTWSFSSPEDQFQPGDFVVFDIVQDEVKNVTRHSGLLCLFPV